MVYSLQEGMDARWVTILTLLVTVAVLFVFYRVIKMSPLENLDVRVITWPALGRNFLFLLLLMANNLLAYPSFDLSRGRTDRLPSRCSLFYLLAWTEYPRGMGSLRGHVLDLNLGGLSLQADRI